MLLGIERQEGGFCCQVVLSNSQFENHKILSSNDIPKNHAVKDPDLLT